MPLFIAEYYNEPAAKPNGRSGRKLSRPMSRILSSMHILVILNFALQAAFVAAD